MKKILMSAVVMIFAVGALNAQSPWFLGGSLGLNLRNATLTNDNTKATAISFSVNPQVGYMLNKNWGITMDLGYATDAIAVDDEEAETINNMFGFGVGAIYKYRITDMFYLAPTVRIGYARETESKSNYISEELNFLRFELRPAKRWGINFNFGGLGYGSFIPDDGDTESELDFTVGKSAVIGFNFHF